LLNHNGYDILELIKPTIHWYEYKNTTTINQFYKEGYRWY
jgi:hypothetical protein